MFSARPSSSVDVLCVGALLTTLLAGSALAADDGRGFVRTTSGQAGEARIALVIGNGGYKAAPLKNPVRDAKLMAEALADVGFEVDARFDLSRNDMLRAIRRFGDRLRETRGVGMFYFAGHGMQVDGRSYLIPIKADIRVEADVELEAVDATRVLARMEEANNRLNLVVLDACRNNPVGRSVRSRDSGLAFINAPSGTLISYATAPGRVAADGRGNHSYYSESLAHHLRTPGLRVEDVFKKVRASVQKATRGEQTPWESSSLTGDFYFVGQGGPSPSTPAPEAAAADNSGDKSIVYERNTEPEPTLETDDDGDKAYRRSDEDIEAESYRRNQAVDLAGVSALEAKLSWHRTVVNYTEWLGYIGWAVGLTGFGLSAYAAASFIGASLGLTLLVPEVAILFLIFGLPMLGCGLVAGAGLCGTAYLFRTFADDTVGEIREKDPSWSDNGNDGCSPSMLF